MPAMGRADLLAALALECRKHVNFEIEDSEIRYEILGRTDRGDHPELLLHVCVAHPTTAMVDVVQDAAGVPPVTWPLEDGIVASLA